MLGRSETTFGLCIVAIRRRVLRLRRRASRPWQGRRQGVTRDHRTEARLSDEDSRPT